MNRKIIGKEGEKLAINFLEKKGYTILEKNFRCFLGEIDIIGLNKKIIVFIEVKLRNSNKFGLAQNSLIKTKQKRLKKIALYYLKTKNLLESSSRFDVVAINLENKKYKITLFKNAF